VPRKKSENETIFKTIKRKNMVKTERGNRNPIYETILKQFEKTENDDVAEITRDMCKNGTITPMLESIRTALRTAIKNDKLPYRVSIRKSANVVYLEHVQA